VALRIREPVRLFGARKVAALLQQRAEVECAVGLTALVRAAVARFRVAEVAALLQQDAEVERRGRIAP
jgi:hypothetical protein